ncbi:MULTISPECIES: MFS transporter [unclassified Rhodococcus (in: high G+C Gram-positive bacteria)]|uniref:MFS transporter n=1 Tax=unclassified Rhodococcus (in: high G+C Gram-positive bacteria) TaxID=192944 RepID=UPI000B9A4C94|nr:MULTISPECIES: MFS transporter [unclassified Rhodococcus (in: high G+C Gram-positive bacteria)]OZE34124.1 MFS transporter [Rhodococcus sp. 05-2254-4]OZE51322.1 MFS transporter [Rhodococcus sp. 05-2254-3]OZE52973.1 MFS transporter [Rhodococcus sp. 05-2254-2]
MLRRNIAFRRLFTAQVVALLGTGLLTVALGLLAYDIAGSAAGAVLGTALAIKMIAYVFVAPIVSSLTNTLPTKLVLVTADAVRALTALALPFVDQVWQVYVLIFVLQAASATFTPTFQAVIPSVVPDAQQYTRALTLSRLAYDLESLVSPLIAAALLTVIGFHTLFVGTALGFVVSAMMVVGTVLPKRTTPKHNRPTTGITTFVRNPELQGLLALNTVVAAATALVVVNSVVYVRDLFGGSSSQLAIALGVYGAGSMVAALFIPRALRSTNDHTLMLAGAATAVVGTAAATAVATLNGGSAAWIALATTWALLGVGTSMINTPSARVLRRESDESTRTSIFTAQFSLSHAAFLLTYPVAGWVGAQFGLFTAAMVLTGLATLAALTAARLWSRTRMSVVASA